MSNILFTTIGLSWQIVPELFGFTNPDTLPLYKHHSGAGRIAELRGKYDVSPVDEIWAVGTIGDKSDRSFEQLLKWHAALTGKDRPVMRLWQVSDVEDLVSERECRLMREAIFRLVLHARSIAGNEKLFLSLAGGRKTMSSDMQRAAAFFGCHCLIHVIDDGRRSHAGNQLAPLDFAGPLPDELASAYMPLVTGSYPASPMAFLEDEGHLRFSPERFPIKMPENRRIGFFDGTSAELNDQIEECEKNAGYLVTNYTNQLLQGEPAANFLALYNLSPEIIARLKSTRIGMDPARADVEKAWLRRLPKTDLHCHLGGVADAAEILEIVQAYQAGVNQYYDVLSPQLAVYRKIAERKLSGSDDTPFDFKGLRSSLPDLPEPLLNAALVLSYQNAPASLDRLIFGPYLAEDVFCGVGFGSYEQLGDVQGSGLLQARSALQIVCQALARKANRDNIHYLEIRCSPANYTRAGLSAEDVVRTIEASLKAAADFDYQIILTASRHRNMDRIKEQIELALAFIAAGDQLVAGFDLAGSEAALNPEMLREAFLPLMRQCFHFTIHAGEDLDVSSIWEAVYHLNAERIGHGLTLKHNPELMNRFKDRRIGLEMCPSSNYQIVGFRDNYYSQTRELETYPLKAYLDAGLAVSVNTDNPGISRTDWTNELHKAARLTPDGLSLWEVLLLIKNGFKAAFASRQRRQQMLLTAEQEVIEIVRHGLPV
ncbi:MAG: CRISPR-associated ring nuclease [Desulfobacterales bacterium]